MRETVIYDREHDWYIVSRDVDDTNRCCYAIDKMIIEERARQRPNHDVMGFVIPWTWNMVEWECLNIARPHLDRMVSNWRAQYA